MNSPHPRPTLRALAALAVLAVAAGTAQALTIGRIEAGDFVAQLNLSIEPVALEAARRAGVALVFKPLPPLRGLEAANDGETDGELARVADVAARYPHLVIVPTPVSKAVLAIYAATPAIATRTRAEIRKMRIGILRGHFMSEKYSRGLTIIESGAPASLLDLLTDGRCDAVMLDYFDTASHLERKHATSFYPWRYAWATEPLYLMINRKHAALVPRLNAALQQMQREGLIDKAYADGLRLNRIAPPPGEEPAQR